MNMRIHLLNPAGSATFRLYRLKVEIQENSTYREVRQ